MTEQASVDLEFEQQTEDYLAGELTNIPIGNIFYFIEKFGAFPALENVSVIEILERRGRRNSQPKDNPDLPF